MRRCATAPDNGHKLSKNLFAQVHSRSSITCGTLPITSILIPETRPLKLRPEKDSYGAATTDHPLPSASPRQFKADSPVAFSSSVKLTKRPYNELYCGLKEALAPARSETVRSPPPACLFVRPLDRVGRASGRSSARNALVFRRFKPARRYLPSEYSLLDRETRSVFP